MSTRENKSQIFSKKSFHSGSYVPPNTEKKKSQKTEQSNLSLRMIRDQHQQNLDKIESLNRLQAMDGISRPNLDMKSISLYNDSSENFSQENPTYGYGLPAYRARTRHKLDTSVFSVAQTQESPKIHKMNSLDDSIKKLCGVQTLDSSPDAHRLPMEDIISIRFGAQVRQEKI
mgnify:CR=1 FL=1